MYLNAWKDSLYHLSKVRRMNDGFHSICMNDGTEKQCLKPYIHIRYFLRLIRWHNNRCKKHIVMIYHFNQIQVHRYYSRGMIADFLPFRRKCFRICIDILICSMLSECVCVARISKHIYHLKGRRWELYWFMVSLPEIQYGVAFIYLSLSRFHLSFPSHT